MIIARAELVRSLLPDASGCFSLTRSVLYRCSLGSREGKEGGRGETLGTLAAAGTGASVVSRRRK